MTSDRAEQIRIAIARVCNADRRAVLPTVRALGDVWTVEQVSRLHRRAEELSPDDDPINVIKSW